MDTNAFKVAIIGKVEFMMLLLLSRTYLPFVYDAGCYTSIESQSGLMDEGQSVVQQVCYGIM